MGWALRGEEGSTEAKRYGSACSASNLLAGTSTALRSLWTAASTSCKPKVSYNELVCSSFFRNDPLNARHATQETTFRKVSLFFVWSPQHE